MRGRIGAVVCLVTGIVVGTWGHAAPSTQAKTGTIKGTVKLSGPWSNDVIRMGMDPKCADMNRGKTIAQEKFTVDKTGGLANVFVRVQGSFPATPVPTTPVKINQKGCVYSPRVVGARVGQSLEIRNDDPLSHNSHSQTLKSNAFNVSQGRAGLVFDYKLKNEEIFLKLTCDIHRWMVAYVGVVSNPYFAVSEPGGSFVIDKIPEGTYTVEARHEVLGAVTKSVKITAGTVTPADFTFTVPAKKP